MANKYCTKCSEDLPVSMFYKKSSRSDGLQSHCRDCQKVYKDSYYRRNSKAIIKAVGIDNRKSESGLCGMVRLAKAAMTSNNYAE